MVKALKNRRGAAMLEYGLLAALIALVVIVTLTPVGTQIAGVFTSIGNALP
jgi:pilus assembly protein Flp/PilA